MQPMMDQGTRPIGGDAAEADQADVDINTKTVAELKAIAKEKEIEGYSSLTKEELLAVLKGVV